MARYLLDTNILLRASDPGSASFVEASQATARLLNRGEGVFITAQNLIEFWGVATRPLGANGLGWSVQKAALEIQQILR